MGDIHFIIIISIGAAVLLYVTRRWFWLLAFSSGAIVCLFRAWDCMIHSEMLGVFIFLLLAVVCGVAIIRTRESYKEEKTET